MSQLPAHKIRFSNLQVTIWRNANAEKGTTWYSVVPSRSYKDGDDAWKDTDSRLFLRETLARLNQAGWQVVNVDVIIFAQEPKLGPIKAAIRANLADLLGLDAGAVNVKAKTGEHVGPIGRGEAIACEVAVLIDRTKEPRA